MKLIDPLHFIGIGGAGMSSLALFFQAKGYQVQGSDSTESSTLQMLREKGISIFLGHAASSIEKIKTVIYSSAISPSNPELQAAQEKKLLLLHRSDLLALIIAEKKKSITVSGTHGKTTTSFLLTHILQALGKNPSYIIGGQNLDTGSSCQYNENSEYFVAESDESDGSFLQYHPFGTIITNIENDHLDHYQTISSLETAFIQHIDHVQPNGFVVINPDYVDLASIQQKTKKSLLTFGFSPQATLHIVDFYFQDGAMKVTLQSQTESCSFQLPLLGKHNVENATAALLATTALGIPLCEAAQTLSSFSGVKKRWETHYQDENLIVIEDYAHNPGKIQAAVSTAKKAFPTRQILVLFQPHRFARLETAFSEFTHSFLGADLVITVPVFSVRDTVSASAPYAQLIEQITQASHVPCFFAPDTQTLTALLSQHVQNPTLLLCVGAGDIHKLAWLAKDHICEEIRKENS